MPRTPSEGLFIGLMSGTSADAVDAALLEIKDNNQHLIACHSTSWPEALREQVVALFQPGDNEIDRFGKLHRQIGELFADAALALLERCDLTPEQIVAIGSHGQTLRHRPGPEGFSLQAGSGDVIANRTGITTVSDFRNRDMVLGGQGAPLVPRFHQIAFAHGGERRAVINIGGIANVSLLDDEALVGGFDTGPGNALLDHWCLAHTGEPWDENGTWAASGQVLPDLLANMLSDPYFSRPAPKSTGRELFNDSWLRQYLGGREKDCDVQATLTELTATTICEAVAEFGPDKLLICGGGAHNSLLMRRLQALQPAPVANTTDYGIDPDWVEAAAFAWLAWARLAQVPGNAPEVTGASRPALLGAVHAP